MTKKIKHVLFILFIACTSQAHSQIGTTIYVDGSHIMGPCSDTLILRGVDYAPYGWGWSPTQLNIDQVALTGANCVRLTWYNNTPDGATPQATYSNLVYLDSALSKCIQKKLIPIIELHDQTCQNNPAALITLANWYIQPGVLALINKYKHSLIINIANEALFVDWTADPVTAQTTFINTYTTIATNLRSNGITVPIMIDGPECGTNLDVLASVGNTLELNDPSNNLIFSAHAYWYSYAGNDSTQMLNKINNAISQGIPFLFGEIANLQDDAVMCQYTLNYQPLLNICKQKKIGWLAWSWDNDACSARQMSTAGSFSSLTPYGNDIVNNASYGLLTHPSPKSNYLVYGSCVAAVINDITIKNNVSLYPNPSTGIFTVRSSLEVITIKAFNVMGEEVALIKSGSSYSFMNAANGIYYIQVTDKTGMMTTRKIIVK
jgi:mannan endo-1,4-beta-mannosidase